MPQRLLPGEDAVLQRQQVLEFANGPKVAAVRGWIAELDVSAVDKQGMWMREAGGLVSCSTCATMEP